MRQAVLVTGLSGRNSKCKSLIEERGGGVWRCCKEALWVGKALLVGGVEAPARVSSVPKEVGSHERVLSRGGIWPPKTALAAAPRTDCETCGARGHPLGSQWQSRQGMAARPQGRAQNGRLWPDFKGTASRASWWIWMWSGRERQERWHLNAGQLSFQVCKNGGAGSWEDQVCGFGCVRWSYWVGFWLSYSRSLVLNIDGNGHWFSFEAFVMDAGKHFMNIFRGWFYLVI